MGLIITKFRKKKSNSELLDQIDKDIKSIESFQRNTEEQRKKIVGKFLVVSVGIYILSAVLFYFYFNPKDWTDRFWYLVPFVLAPTAIFISKRVLTWYYNRKLTKNGCKIVDLRVEKKRILEEIMETETYKVARAILEKYAPEQVRKVNLNQELTPIKNPTAAAGANNNAMVTPANHSGLRNRIPPGSRIALNAPLARPQAPTIGVGLMAGPSQVTMTPARTSLFAATPSIQQRQAVAMAVPRNIPSKERTFLDKMVDYLIGDGPNNRYALICKQCSGHNGMALVDEFEFISFKCCYCLALNPARKRRPTAPKLQTEEFTAGTTIGLADNEADETSESEKQSGSDSSEDGTEARKSPSLQTLFKKQTAEQAVGADEMEAAVSSDNEPNDFDKLSDLENRDDGEKAAATRKLFATQSTADEERMENEEVVEKVTMMTASVE